MRRPSVRIRYGIASPGLPRTPVHLLDNRWIFGDPGGLEISRRSGTIAVGASKRRTAFFALPLVVAIVGLVTAGAPGVRAQSVDALVTVGSPATTTPQNSQ